MTSLSLKDIQTVELEILDYVAQVCEEHHLTYFLSYGTLIGAIRHQGFIPWDDDIDIAMPREDYNCLLDILRQEKGKSKYACFTPQDEGYYYLFAKVVDTTTTIVEEKALTPFPMGVWIDIFPLDGLKRNDNCQYYQLLLYNRACAAAVNLKFPRKTSKWLQPLEYTFWKLCRLIGYAPFLKRALTLSEKYKYVDCEEVGFAYSYPAYNKYMKKEWFEETVMVEFEGRKFRAPARYHDYLTTQYGDYMQLPPENKRITHHITVYRNATECH